MIFENRGLIHEDFEGFGAVGGVNHDFIEGVSEGGVFGGDFEEFLAVHDEDDTNVAGFEDRGEEIADIDRARAFFEEEVGIIETEDNVFGGVDFIEDFDH